MSGEALCCVVPVQDQRVWCPKCDYNLTGNASGRCPECGWQIDCRLVGRDEEDRRIGTPVYCSRRFARVKAIVTTVLLLLFRPISLARQLRWDEPLWPAMLAAVLSCAVLVAVPVLRGESIRRSGAHGYLAGALTQIGLQTAAFAILARWRPWRLTWWQRFRLALLISLYSTCFVACWPVLGYPPAVGWGEATNFLSPFHARPSGGWFSADGTLLQFTLRSVAFYWWWLIVGIFFVIRAQPRRCGVLLAISVPLIAVPATWVAVRIAV